MLCEPPLAGEFVGEFGVAQAAKAAQVAAARILLIIEFMF
jgi:hypothetical protein